jgi:hypothetical protein
MYILDTIGTIILGISLFMWLMLILRVIIWVALIFTQPTQPPRTRRNRCTTL